MTEQQEIRFKGLGVSEGVVIGQVLRMHDTTEHVYHWRIEPSDLETEFRLFLSAADVAKQQVIVIKHQAEVRLGKEHDYIFDAHLLMLEDEILTSDIEKE